MDEHVFHLVLTWYLRSRNEGERLTDRRRRKYRHDQAPPHTHTLYRNSFREDPPLKES